MYQKKFDFFKKMEISAPFGDRKVSFTRLLGYRAVYHWKAEKKCYRLGEFKKFLTFGCRDIKLKRPTSAE